MTNLGFLTHNWKNTIFIKAETATNIVRDLAICLGNFAGRGICYFKAFPSHMQANQTVAVATILGSNLVIFATIYKITSLVNRRIQMDSQLDSDQITVKNLLLDFITGVSTLTFNVVFSKITHYPLHPLIPTAFIISNIILRRVFQKEMATIRPTA